ncbi:shikimate kinase [Cohnella sp.]|uniref:shikimate kinase n=1 Tax=Cohnella sp. TaxID=1883426 RepID=UPI002580CC56|nr:shikimate kinase [Cohnella sp.]
MSVRAKPRNVILVGFMGTGKSTVSRLLAGRLGWERIDTDDEVVRQAGKTIPDIFAEEGEAAFRDWESRVLQEVLARSRHIVATGGGAVLREENRRLMLAGGWVVALTADRETLLRRVTEADPAGTGARPLLKGDAAERIDRLLRTRRHAYDFAHATVDTSGRTPAEVAELLLRWML